MRLMAELVVPNLTLRERGVLYLFHERYVVDAFVSRKRFNLSIILL